jgi:CheY-like chemotaxis protein
MVKNLEEFKIVILDDDREKWIQRFKKLLEAEFPNADIENYNRPDEFFALRDEEVDADIILLDVVNMGAHGPDKAIPTIRARWPRLPIIILSKKKELSDALKYFILGARGYIVKKIDTIPKVPMMFGNEAHHSSLVEDWDKATSQIRFLVNEYKPIKRILDDERDIGWVKKEMHGPKSIIPDQIDFLEYIRRARSKTILSSRFPRVLRKDHNPTSYQITFYRAKSLRKTLFEMTDPDAMIKTAQAVLGLILPDLKSDLFDYRPTTLTNHDWYIDQYYTGKLQARIEELHTELQMFEAIPDLDDNLVHQLNSIRQKVEDADFQAIKEKKALLELIDDTTEILATPPRIATIQKNALLDLLQSEKIRVGKSIKKQPLTILKQLLADRTKRKRLLPKKVGSIHGDLHFDNILVDMTVPEKPFVKLIDPRGFKKPADFAYDVGKLLHSCHGKYDMIDEGYYLIKNTSDLVEKSRLGTVTVSPPVREEWVPQKQSGGSRDAVTSFGNIIKGDHYEAYDKIERWLIDEFLPDLLEDDPDWKIRAYLNEALHFCTMGPFHLERNPMKVFTLYIQGLILMNEVASHFE